ncbi:MAG: UDP-N-acetylmuramoyl-tripeptide--D-alanyl-D-alanine ligase [Bacilli bacterium]|nr:UDP-N-acetylmuramoyl-tripeptide--D-alanyl-D-alanine ligase [Bacilli bacterium]
MFYLIILSMILLLFFKSKKSLHMLQQNLYNENNRYIKWIGKNALSFINIELFAIFMTLMGYFVFFDTEKYTRLAQILIIIIYLISVSIWYNKLKKEQKKKPLVVTKRVERLIITLIILHILPIVFLILNIKNTKTSFIIIFAYTIILYLNNFIIYLAKIINTPVEKCVARHFENMAQKKLRSMTDLKIVGITGSYGKTSSKNILADILNVKYNALPTPKNFNTHNGLLITINNNLDKFTDIFIAEMGAYVKGDIQDLCDMIHPKYGILTKIGTAHLESFGSEKNIIEGKFELIESLPSDGIGVLNRDDEKQVSYKLKNNCKIIWIGIENKDVDVYATNIECSNIGTKFDVLFKGDKTRYPFECKLLGDHNVYNILASIALGREFGIEIKDLQKSVRKVKPVEHRLELKTIGNFYMIDDAYNSNPIGAKNAIEVLGMMPGIKIVVTPGMIELAEKEEELNEKFGEQIAEVADYVVLIGEKKTEPIKKGLKNKKYNFDNVVIYNDVTKAYNFINGIKNENRDSEVYALFENDLPDTYNE